MNSILRSVAFGRVPRLRARFALAIVLAGTATLLSMSAGRASSIANAVQAETVDTGDGYLDRIDVMFSTPLVPNADYKISSGPGDPGIRVDGYEISSIRMDQGNATRLQIALVRNPSPDTGATPAFVYESGAPAGQELRSAIDEEELATQQLDTLDRAAPVLVYVSAKDVAPVNMFNVAGDSLRLRFSEPVTLAGAAPLVRWDNLERAIRFSPEGQNVCRDGNPGNPLQSFNFPQPSSGSDPVESPAPAEFATTIRVTMKPGNVQPPEKFPAIPVGCKVGIDNAGDQFITDAAGNLASNEDRPTPSSSKMWVQPADIELEQATTIDGFTGSADGSIDAIEFKFDQRVIDATAVAEFRDIAISVGETAATGLTFHTGTPEDSRFTIAFSLPAGSSWDTGTRPRVRYDKPSSCTGSGGEGMKGEVPAGPGYNSCVASFDQQSADGAAPLLLSTRTADADGNGSLDRLVATFSEQIAAGGHTGWTIDGRGAMAFGIDADDARKASVDVPESGSADTALLPSVAFARGSSASVFDAAGKELLAFAGTASADGAAPRIRTATVRDTDTNGNIDAIELEYSESIVDPSASAGAFSIGGTGASSIVTGTANDSRVTLRASVPGTGAKQIVFDGDVAAIRDAAGNASGDQTIEPATVVDEAAPVGAISISQGAPMNAGEKTVVVSFGEPMATAAAPTVTLGDLAVQPVTDTEHTNGWRNDDPSRWEGSVTVAPTSCTQPTGCPVTLTGVGASDTRGNAQARPATLDTEIDTIAPTAPTVGTFTAHQASGPNAPANVVNASTEAFSLGASFAAGDAAGGRAEILVDGEPLTPPARSSVIGASATTTSARTAFADAAALQAAIPEGTHALGIRLCDDAANCVDGGTLGIVADYAPVGVTLSQPSGGGTIDALSRLTISWDGDDTATGFDHVELSYTVNGVDYQAIANDTRRDGSYTWRVPWFQTATARVRVTSVDVNGNRTAAPSEAFTVELPRTFSDVPFGSTLHESAERLAAAGVYTGCGGGRFCPSAKLSRVHTAIFLIKAMGHDGHLPAYRGYYRDVPRTASWARYVEHARDHGILGACDTRRRLFCPGSAVTRAQLAVAVLRAAGHHTHLPAYRGYYTDVSSRASYARYAEHLRAHRVYGCSSTRFCPTATVTRGYMAIVFARVLEL